MALDDGAWERERVSESDAKLAGKCVVELAREFHEIFYIFNLKICWFEWMFCNIDVYFLVNCN